MNKVKIITDSTVDLSLETLKELDVEMMPLGVSFGDELYRDMVDITTKELYEKIDSTGIMPKSSAINPSVFSEKFKEFKDQGYDCIYMGIGSKISSTYQSACQAAKEFEGVYCIDSLNLSSAIGLQVMKMCKFRDEGKSASEIVELMKEVTPKVKCSFVIDTLEYLRKGGRCSGLTFFVGKALSIKPTIVMKNGELKVGRIATKLVKAADLMIGEFKAKYEKGEIDPDHVMVTHSFNDELCKYISDKLSEFCDPKMIMPTNAGCVISTHCGPKCIGILYIEK